MQQAGLVPWAAGNIMGFYGKGREDQDQPYWIPDPQYAQSFMEYTFAAMGECRVEEELIDQWSFDHQFV